MGAKTCEGTEQGLPAECLCPCQKPRLRGRPLFPVQTLQQDAWVLTSSDAAQTTTFLWVSALERECSGMNSLNTFLSKAFLFTFFETCSWTCTSSLLIPLTRQCSLPPWESCENVSLSARKPWPPPVPCYYGGVCVCVHGCPCTLCLQVGVPFTSVTLSDAPPGQPLCLLPNKCLLSEQLPPPPPTPAPQSTGSLWALS